MEIRETVDADLFVRVETAGGGEDADAGGGEGVGGGEGEAEVVDACCGGWEIEAHSALCAEPHKNQIRPRSPRIKQPTPLTTLILSPLSPDHRHMPLKHILLQRRSLKVLGWVLEEFSVLLEDTLDGGGAEVVFLGGGHGG